MRAHRIFPSRTWSSLVFFAWRCSFEVCMFLRLANGLVADCCCCCCWEWGFGDDAILFWNFRLNHSLCVCVMRPTKESELYYFHLCVFVTHFLVSLIFGYTHTHTHDNFVAMPSAWKLWLKSFVIFQGQKKAHMQLEAKSKTLANTNWRCCFV